MQKEKRILFSGYAKLPTGTASSELYKVMGLVVLVDIQTGRILEADCTLSTRLSERFVADILVGGSIDNEGVEKLKEKVNDRYQGSAKKAIITAINTIRNRYITFMKGLSPRETEAGNC